MKLNYIKRSLIPALAVVLSLSSCLKDDNANLDFDSVSGKVYVGIADASPSSSTFNSTSFGVVSSAAESTTQLTLTYIGAAANSGTDVTIKVETDKKIIDQYNAARGTNYLPLEPANYSLPSTKITIPAGQKTVKFPVVIKPSTITNTNAAYVLPIVITDASGKEISGNYGKHMVLVTIKNPYDGVYASSLHFVRVNIDERYTNADKTLSTVNSTTSATLYADLGTDYTMELTVNPDNSVTVTPTGGTISGDTELPGPFTQVGVNKYDPATKTFTLHYQYRGNLRIVEETLVRK